MKTNNIVGNYNSEYKCEDYSEFLFLTKDKPSGWLNNTDVVYDVKDTYISNKIIESSNNEDLIEFLKTFNSLNGEEIVVNGEFVGVLKGVEIATSGFYYITSFEGKIKRVSCYCLTRKNEDND